MPIPDYQTIMLPLLKIVGSNQSISLREAVDSISREFSLTKEEIDALLPSGNQEIILNRVGWARTYLKKAGLLDYPKRGIMEITERGLKVLKTPPAKIDNAFLMQFPEFQQFRAISNEESETEITSTASEQAETPEESLEAAYLRLREALLDEVIEKVKSCSPKFFEQLVVDTIVRMGYGGSRKEAGKAVGQSGDEGIDGIINEDRLGLDVIYLQAKRWEDNVGRPEIQKFAGALQGKRARKGVFITTSDFSSEAKEFVKNIDAKIVLISGRQLASLMWEHNIGITTAASFEVKRLDSEFFAE